MAFGERVAHLLEEKTIYSEKTSINFGAIVLRQRLICTPSDIIDAKKCSEQTVRHIPSSSASVVADAIMRHKVLMIEFDEAIHRGAVVGHIVRLNGAAVVSHGEILDPFLVDGRGLLQGRVAERVAGGWLLFVGVEVSAGV